MLKAVVTGILWVAGPPCARVAERMRAALATLQLAYLYVTIGRRQCSSFAEFRSSLGEDDEFKASGNNGGPKVEDLPAYERALHVLGLSAEEASSMPTVRKRYRELQAIVHPDRGMPTTVFSQMVNEAFDTIKRESGIA